MGDGVNPVCFGWQTWVFFDELDPLGHLHNSRYAVHVERAQTALFERLLPRREPHDDLRYVVRELRVEYLRAVRDGLLVVEMSAERIGATSATYAFRCTDEARDTTYAIGHRVIVKVGADGHPEPWSAWYRAVFEHLATGTVPLPDHPGSTA